jgi:hypothetical protein
MKERIVNLWHTRGYMLMYVLAIVGFMVLAYGVVFSIQPAMFLACLLLFLAAAAGEAHTLYKLKVECRRVLDLMLEKVKNE